LTAITGTMLLRRGLLTGARQRWGQPAGD